MKSHKNIDSKTSQKNLTRRKFIYNAAGICLYPHLIGSTLAAEVTNQKKQQLLRRIPSSGELIPAVGMGTSRTFNADISNRSEMDTLQEVLAIFYAMGGRLLDTSPMYDKAEQVSGHLVKQLGIENKLFTATKVWTYGEQSGIEQMQSSFDLLADKPLDLMQIHNLRDWKIHLRTLRDWKEKGIIRYIGITHYRTDAFDDLEKIMQSEDIDWVQLNYSIATREAEEKLLPLAQDKGIATMINRPFERGALFNKTRGKKLPEWVSDYDINSWGQFFLKYILSHQAVTSVIPATSKPKHMKDNMSAGIGVMLDSQGIKKMKSHFEQL